MPESLQLSLVATVIIALLFDFSNGWNDAANSIATVVSTRVLRPWQAVALAATLNFVGIFLGTAVAKTIGTDLVDSGAITSTTVIMAMLAALSWTILMTRIGLPISASHSLIGGLGGAAVGASGSFGVLKAAGLSKVLLALFISPVAGFVLGLLLMFVLLHSFGNKAYGPVNRAFGKLQLLSVSWMSVVHGANDAQKVMGVITMALVAAGTQSTFEVPLWVKLSCHASIALGTAIGGWRVIRTLGMGLTKLRPVHGFSAETAASCVLLATATIGVPVSTTHTVTGAILGVGASQRLSAVRWGLGAKILSAWVVTLPFTFVLGVVLAALTRALTE
jgi:PiT family inorganic phosphate transporter